MKVVILSAGAVGGDVARELTKAGVVDEMVVADADINLARSVADEVGASAVAFDAADRASVDAVIKGADIVFNGVGPFYRYGMTIVRAAVDAGVHYVDVCDEFDVAEELMNSPDLDAAAKKAGVTVLTGMGFAPGLTNLAARWAVDDLTSAHTVNIVLGVPYRVNMGVTINDHMLHSMTGNVTQFVDGAYRSVPAWGDPQPYTMIEPFGTYGFGYMGHAEGITLPRYIPGLRNAAVRFAWFEPEGVQLWKDLDRFGFLDGDIPEGMSISPREFLATYMGTKEGQASLSLDVGEQVPGNVWHVAVDGEKDGVATRIVIEAHLFNNRPQRGGPGSVTAIPAAAGMVELIQGRWTRRGIVSPEACTDPEPFVRKAADAMGLRLYRKVTRVEHL